MTLANAGSGCSNSILPMTSEDATKVMRVLCTDDNVFGLAIDSLLRQGGNEMTAGALLRGLQQLDFSLENFHDQLSQFISEFSQGDPSILIGFDDGRWQDLPVGEITDDAELSSSPSVHHLRVIHSSEDASFYLFFSGSRILEGCGITGGARKREGAIHHVRVELSHPRFLQQVLTRTRECPHVIRIEESTEAEFWAAPSHNPGY
jgi:hypothetical protein